LDKQALIDAVGRSGGKQSALDEADALWAKLDCLKKTGRYGLLLSQLFKANDKSNFLALVLEANFAYQFEAQGLELTYEVKQYAQHKSSIAFCVRYRAVTKSTSSFVSYSKRCPSQTQSRHSCRSVRCTVSL